MFRAKSFHIKNGQSRKRSLIFLASDVSVPVKSEMRSSSEIEGIGAGTSVIRKSVAESPTEEKVISLPTTDFKKEL